MPYHCWLDDRKGISPVKKTVPFIAKSSLPEQVEDEKRGGTG